MKIEQLWATPIGVTRFCLTPERNRVLVDHLLERDTLRTKVRSGARPFKSYVESGGFYNEIHYNLFDCPTDAPEHDAIRAFEQMACGTFRQYLHDGFGLNDAETVALSARCFGHIHHPGIRTFPHYHQASDGVLVHYLKVDEIGQREEPLSLILLDPRGAPNFPWTGKMHTINPVEGTTVCHPSYLWHETNEWRGDSYRALLAVNFKVIGHGHERQFKPVMF